MDKMTENERIIEEMKSLNEKYQREYEVN